MIKVSKLDILPKLASEIYFRITNIEEELINFEELSLILRNRLKEKILFLGNKIHIRFYGKKIVIQIMDCKHYNADISNEMLNLSLDEITFSSDENTEFICTNKNKWENIMSYPQNLRFGGYGSLISELKQNMSSVLKIRSSLGNSIFTFTWAVYFY